MNVNQAALARFSGVLNDLGGIVDEAADGTGLLVRFARGNDGFLAENLIVESVTQHGVDVPLVLRAGGGPGSGLPVAAFPPSLDQLLEGVRQVARNVELVDDGIRVTAHDAARADALRGIIRPTLDGLPVSIVS